MHIISYEDLSLLRSNFNINHIREYIPSDYVGISTVNEFGGPKRVSQSQ